MNPNPALLTFASFCARFAPTVLVVLALSAYYVFQVTLGTFTTLPWNTQYYDMTAAGFRAGHLYLTVEPRPELLAIANPYNPLSVYRELWLWDALLYNRHYYTYWGPVPALCALAFRALTGYAGKIYDQWLVLVFMLGRLYAGAALLWSLARYSAPHPPRWAVLLAIALFALASPTMFVMARPVIYEASVAAGQCFFYWGLVAAFWGVARPRRRVLAFLLAGTLFGLAFNSRVTMILATPGVFVVTAVALWLRSGRALWLTLRRLVPLALPIIAFGIACGAYNYARFGSATNFGVQYQLTGRQFSSSITYLLPNLASYSFAELDWSCRFPFVQLSIYRTLTRLFVWPADYDTGGWLLGERVGGLLVTATCFWLVPAVLAARLLFRRARRQLQMDAAERGLLSPQDSWLLACSLAMSVALVPALWTWCASMRYLEDVSGGFILAAIVVSFSMLRRSADAGSAWLYGAPRMLFVGLALHTILIGVLLGFSGHNDSFPRQNFPLYSTLVQTLSVCGH